jgi:glyoxylase-like metal-dependent hydrolase (beta-lactamase superfamily II)
MLAKVVTLYDELGTSAGLYSRIMKFAIQIIGSVGAAVILAGCTPAPPEQRFLDDALRAMGGRERVAAVKTVVLEGEGVNYNLGQDMKPEAATQTFAVTGYTRKIDVAGGRQRVEQTRTPKFAYFQGPQPQTQIQGVDGAVGFNVNPAGEAARIAPQAERDRRVEFFHHPITALRAALGGQATISNVRTVGTDVRQADFTSADAQWTMTIDAAGLPLSISSRTYHPNLGDVVMTTTFAEYQDTNGVKLPAKLTGKVDEFTTWETRATKQSIDADLGDLAAPAAVTAKTVTPAPPNVTVQQIGKGVWLLGGQSHHSALIEFNDHLMLIDAPQSEARTLAVIAKAKETLPNKSLNQLVTTHHHFDHTAGMRAAIYSGLSVITHAGNKEWVENMARRPHTIQQDILAKNVSRLTVETVDAEREFRDNTMTVMLYHIDGNPHSDTMLMAYIPRDGILIQVDAFSPGSAVNPYAANLLENIQKRNLAVKTIVPLHGAVTTYAELVKAAGGARTN